MIETANNILIQRKDENEQTRMAIAGYRHPQYASSLREFGEPLFLPNSRGWILKQSIAETDYADARGCYPLFSCPDWQGLAEDIRALDRKGIVSLTLVTDPFTTLSFESLKKIFSDHYVPFKEHYLVDFLRQPRDIVSSHHRYYARRALRRYQVEKLIDARPYLETWQKLYSALIKRHQISGIQAFSESAFEKQLAMPGSVVFRAYDTNETTGMHIWFATGNRAYHHLSAYSAGGYKNRVSYAMMWEAMHYFYKQGYQWLDLGAGAGLNHKKDGLTVFKEGWSNARRPAYLCGKIFDHGAYTALQKQTNSTASKYFPAYRDSKRVPCKDKEACQNGAGNTRFRRNTDLENLLGEINGLLAGPEREVLNGYSEPQKPVLLIVGAPRSGTTLLMQWLAQSGYFAYPSNLISRFYQAPYIGARIQQMMTDPCYAFRNEMINPANQEDDWFSSDLGKTSGPLAPNEFWYFWRRFFQFNGRDHLTDEELRNVDMQTFLKELAALESAMKKPLAMKGLIINQHIPFIARHLQKVLFIHLRRNPFYNMQSIIHTRQKYFGDTQQWYSFRPPQYPQLKNDSVARQAAGQVYYLNLIVENGLAELDEKYVLQMDYESFCRNPGEWWQRIMHKMAAFGETTDAQYRGPEQFKINNKPRCSAREQQEWIAAWHSFSGERPKP